MNDAASVLMWGGKGSGKSGFLGALWHAGGSGDDAKGRWCISPGDIHDVVTRNYLIDAHTMLREGLRRATMPAPDYPELRLTARRWVAGSPRAALELAFTDPAGEFADDAVRARQQGSQLLERMTGGAGVIWLFDCLSESRPHLDQIVRQIGTLRQRTGGDAVRTPVAFCLSRVDLLSDEARTWVLQDPEGALRGAVGEDIMAQLEGAFPNRQFFAISSRGFDAERIEPVGLNEVLDWVHANQRMTRVLGFGRRWYRQAAVAAAVLVVLGIAGMVAADYLYGDGASERRLAEQRELGELELGGRLFAEGRHDSAIAVLRGANLSRRHPRSVERDTLLAMAAHQLGALRVLANGTARGDSLLDLAVDYSGRALRNLDETDAQARIRFVRAESCMLASCSVRDVRRDLEWIVDNTSDARLRQDAERRLAEMQG